MTHLYSRLFFIPFSSTFGKTLTLDDINLFICEDKLKCLTVEATNGCYYGFNLSNNDEKLAAMNVVVDKDDFTVVGWKIGNIIPDWVKRYEDWNIYIGSTLEGVVTNQVNNAGANNSEDEFIFEDDSNLKTNNYIESLHDDVEAGEKDIYDNAEKTEDGENKNGQLTTQTSTSSLSIIK